MAFQRGGLLGQAVVLEWMERERGSLEFSLENANGHLSKLELYWLAKSSGQRLYKGKSHFAPGLFSHICQTPSTAETVSLFNIVL